MKGREEPKFRGIPKQEDLCNKLSAKLQFPQRDLIDLCENYSRLLGALTADSNKCHSKPAAENESYDEDQDVVDVVSNLLRQQGAPEVEMDKVSDIPLEYQCFPTMFKETVERKIKYQGGQTRLIADEIKDLIKQYILSTSDVGCNTAITLLNKRYCNPHSLLACYSKEIKSLTPVKSGDAMGFRKIYDFGIKF